MKRLMIAATVASMAASAAQAQYNMRAVAYYTFNYRTVTTVTGQPGTACEYEYMGQKFWRTFAGYITCPQSIEVQ
jgi:hypothetical protein